MTQHHRPRRSAFIRLAAIAAIAAAGLSGGLHVAGSAPDSTAPADTAPGVVHGIASGAAPQHASEAARIAAAPMAYALEESHPLPPSPILALDIARGDDGMVFVADGRGRQVVRLGSDGEVSASWRVGGVPVAVELDQAAGRLHTLAWDGLAPRIETWTLDGAFVELIGIPERRFGPDDDRMALDMSIDADGQPVVLNHGMIHRLNPAGGGGGLVADGGVTHGFSAQPMRMAALGGGRTAFVLKGEKRLALHRRGAGVAWRLDFGARVPLDVAISARGGAGSGGSIDSVEVLLSDAGTPVIATVGVTGTVGTIIGERWLDVPGIDGFGGAEFRWSLAIAPNGAVALTAGTFRTGVWSQPFVDLALMGPFSARRGARIPPEWDLGLIRTQDNPVSSNSGLAIDLNDADEVIILDSADARAVVGLPPWSEFIHPWDAADLSGGIGHLWTIGDDGWIRGMNATYAPEEVASPDGPAFECACSLGGRIAAWPATGPPSDGRGLFFSRPADRSIRALDVIGAGAEPRVITTTDSFGLWPSDIAITPGGVVLAGDLVTGIVQGWGDGAAAEFAWTAGILGGVRRLGATTLDDGREVVAALMADGAVELHTLREGTLLSRFEPVGPDGRPASGADIAVRKDGRILVADAEGRAVHVYAPDGGPPPTPAPTATAAPTAEPSACRLSGEHTVSPSIVSPGEPARVTLTLSADCPPRTRLSGADVILIMDRSSSMAGDPLRAAKGAARSFVELLDVRFHRVGLISFATDVTLDTPLAEDVASVVTAIDALVANGETDISGALEAAADHFSDARRPLALPVIVLLTDGRDTVGTDSPVGAAARMMASGVSIYTIGLGNDVDEDLLRVIASGPDKYFRAPTPTELFPIYREILRLVVSTGVVAEVVIDDILPVDIGNVTGSARPPALEAPSRLTWSRPVLPADGMTVDFEIRPTRPGRQPVSVGAEARFVGDDGIARRFVYDIPEIEVRPPTPTPTPEPFAAFLPIMYREHCLPAKERADVVLLVDASSSMEGEKLVEARRAARAFIATLDLGRDRAALFAFDEHAIRLAPLGSDEAALDAGLDALTLGSGTRIDRALDGALAEITGAAPAPGPRKAAVVLLSDGGQSGPLPPVFDAADALRAAGIARYSIGLGPDVDRTLLSDIADPGGFFFAPRVEDLETIYRRLAGVVRCR